MNSSETSGFIRGWGFTLNALYITIVMSHEALIIHLTWVRSFCKTGGAIFALIQSNNFFSVKNCPELCEEL